jgi:hypothetical protein
VSRAKTGPAPKPGRESRAEREAAARGDVDAILARLARGDRSALPVFRALVDRCPDAFRGDDLARQVEEHNIALLSGKDLALPELMGRRLAAMRASLGGPDPSPLERLLVERIALNWLYLHLVELAASQADREAATLAFREYQQRRVDRAHRRYLASIVALAKVRKLGPEVLISVVQQVNVAAPEAGPSASPAVGLLAGRPAPRD